LMLWPVLQIRIVSASATGPTMRTRPGYADFDGRGAAAWPSEGRGREFESRRVRHNFKSLEDSL
jgi:hypothetical protein